MAANLRDPDRLGSGGWAWPPTAAGGCGGNGKDQDERTDSSVHDSLPIGQPVGSARPTLSELSHERPMTLAGARSSAVHHPAANLPVLAHLTLAHFRSRWCQR